MKQFIFAVMVGVCGLWGAVMTPTQVQADGGVIMNVTTSAPVTITPKLTVAQQITYLETLVKLYAAVQALQMAIPAATTADEGRITTVINDAMRFSCAGKAGTDGEWCTRHLGQLGESYIDVDTVIGFPYDERFAYTLTLQRVRAVTYGEDSQPQHDYFLEAINDLEYQR